MKHYGDIAVLNGAEMEPVDIVTFGSPCFPEGTLVMTEHGYLPIEDVEIGMRVLTHKGRWRKVTETGAKFASTVILTGNHYGLECTPNHPIYCSGERKYYPQLGNGKRGDMILLTDDKEWIPAGAMEGKLWAVPNRAEALPIAAPMRMLPGAYQEMPEMSAGLFYFVGRWLGDGWVQEGQRPRCPEGQATGRIFICDSFDKEDELRRTVEAVTDRYCVKHERTTVNVAFSSSLLCGWLTDNFGRYAIGKTMPGWVFGMPKEYRRALLQGLIDSDGCRVKGKDCAYKITTISKRLAESVRLLAEMQGYSTTVHKTCVDPQTVIEGRVVNQHDWYSVVMTKSKKRVHLKDDLHGWYRVRSVKPTGRTAAVYNMTVEEDNSYVADGIVVHNCQDLSIAGKRAGIQEGRRSNLFFEAVRIIREMREATNGEKPRYALWENVVGAYSSNEGEDFRCVLEELCKVKEAEVSVPAPCFKWSNAGEVVGDGFSIAWRTLDAQYHGVPQRRARIYLVADLAGGSAPEILFNGESVPGYSPTRFKAWQGAAGDLKEGAGEAGSADGGIDVLAADGYNGTVSDKAAALRLNCGGSTGSSAVVLNDQGGQRMDVTEDVTATLRAEAHHPPVVVDKGRMVTAGFRMENSAAARGIGYQEDVAPTLKSSGAPAALKPEEPVSLENHPNDSRVKIIEDGKVQTLSGRMGTGGGNVPLLMEDKPVTLKIRSGCEGGGKGPLLTEDLSATLGTHNDQTLFEPKGDAGDPEEEQTAFGISSYKSHAMLSDNPHAGIYEAKTSRCLDTTGTSPAQNQGGICIVAHKANYDVRFTSDGSKVSRGHVYETETARTLSTDQQDPSGNQGAVAVVEEEKAYALQGSMIGRDEKNGPQGSGVGEDVSFTLTGTDRHAIAFADKAAMLSANDGPKGPSSQMLGNPENSFVAEEPAMDPVNTDTAGRPVYHSSKNSYHTRFSDEKAVDTLVASDYKDPPTVSREPCYIVRRLTPTECARLQGLPDWWAQDLGTEEPTEEDLAFWREVFETHRRTVTHAKKPKTDRQIIKWLKDPQSDSAQYKMYGNGIAVPCAYYVLQGIAYYGGMDSMAGAAGEPPQ